MVQQLAAPLPGEGIVVANFFVRHGLQPDMPQNFWRSLAAVLIGNAVYFACSGFLPPAARHDSAGFDLGLVVDFWFCLVVLGLLELWERHKKGRSRPKIM
jgi:hypothetical protein